MHFVLQCYERINSRWLSEQSSCLSNSFFYCTLFFEYLMLLVWSCIGSMCCHTILLLAVRRGKLLLKESTTLSVWQGVHWKVISWFHGQMWWITIETHRNPAQVGFCAFLDNMKSLLSDSFPCINIPGIFLSLLALSSRALPESPLKLHYPGQHAPCCLGRGTFF